MSTYSSSPGSLWSNGPFRRFAACSAAGHVAALLLAGYGIPRSQWDVAPAIVVELKATAPSEAPEAAPEPPPEPPKPDPPVEPPPEPEAVPEKQIIDEAVIIPEKLEELKPKPAPAVPKPKPKRKPEPVKPKPEPQVSPEDLMKQIRETAQTRPGPQTPSATAGIVDPELAGYLGKVKVCLYQKWVGAGQYQRRPDLSAEFNILIGPGGEVKEAELVRASGIEVIDQGAANAIQRCSPFEPPPRGEALIPVVFRPSELR